MELLTPFDETYSAACLAWNRAVTKKPAIIAFCDTVAELPKLLQLAKATTLPLRIRNGRHHYEGASSGDGAFVLDVSRLQAITIDEVAQTVRIEGGVRNRELYEALAAKGYPFPGGGCPTVGVAGFSVGGGWGYSSRLLGLGCDALIGLTLITTAGETLTINANEQPQLFWALRGGGATDFGIISELTYQLPTKQPIATRIFLDFHFPDSDQAIKLLTNYQTWFVTTPRWFNAKIVFYSTPTIKFGVKLTGLAYADAQTTQALLTDLLAVEQLVTDQRETGPVIHALRWIQDNHPDFESYKSGGRFVETALTPIQWQTLAAWLQQRPTVATYLAFTLYGLGGAVTDTAHDETAFAFRSMNFIFGAQIVWEQREAANTCQSWLINHWSAIEIMTTGSFLNFPFSPQSQANYYGSHWQRFQAVKTDFQANKKDA